METDRELLELAAKAAQLPECGWMGPAFMYVEKNTFTEWNPLTDSGDALRLAVKLRLSIICDNDGKKMKVFSGIAPIWSAESRLPDPDAATRRAIVRASAEIGRSMP